MFHPSGKYLLSASDDKTIKVWDLANGRCTKTIDAHGHFVTCMAWGRATIGGAAPDDAAAAASGDAAKPLANGSAGKIDAEPRRINVLATGSVDNTVKVSLAVRHAQPMLMSADLDTVSREAEDHVYIP